MKKYISLYIITFSGICFEAVHFYGYFRKENGKEIHLYRKVNKHDLNSGYFEGYKLNSKTERFNDLDSILKKASKIYKTRYKKNYILISDSLQKFEPNVNLRKKYFK